MDASTLRTRTGRVRPLLAALLLAGVPSAAATSTHPLAGNARFQIGNGLPIPIAAAAIPNGRVLAVPGATLMQTTGPSPRQLTISPGQLTAPGTPNTLLVFLTGGGNVFQIHTAISVQWPAVPVTLRASGRTGPATVTFCPGQTATLANGLNPACASPTLGSPVAGLMRYTRTASQFGGAAAAAFGGAANIALRVAAGAPCAYAGGANPACQAQFLSGLGEMVAGAAFGASQIAANPGPSPGRFQVTVDPAGQILGITPTGLGPGLPNPATAIAGPWTTGRVTVSLPTGGVFILSGADGRVGGVGSLSLVAGGLHQSALGAPNAQRGWLNLQIGPALGTIPAMTLWMRMLLAAALLGIAAGFGLRRRSAPTSV